MSERGSPSRGPARAPGVIATLIALPLRLVGFLCGSLLLAVVIECLGMHFLWPEQRWHHAQQMLDEELAQLSDRFKQSLVMSAPTHTAQQFVEWSALHLFVKTGLSEWADEGVSRRAQWTPRAGGLPHLLRRAVFHLEDYALAAGYTALTFGVRVLVLGLTMPLLGLAALVGAIDGLVRRDLRRFGAGRESGFLYHRARASLAPLLFLPWVVYLALPVSVHPLVVLLPSAVGLAVAMNLTAGSFKKYL